MSFGVGNGGIWENHLCTGDLHSAGVVGVRERLWRVGGQGEWEGGLWGIRGDQRGFGGLARQLQFLPGRRLLG